jgi:hypothetical protein
MRGQGEKEGAGEEDSLTEEAHEAQGEHFGGHWGTDRQGSTWGKHGSISADTQSGISEFRRRIMRERIETAFLRIPMSARELSYIHLLPPPAYLASPVHQARSLTCIGPRTSVSLYPLPPPSARVDTPSIRKRHLLTAATLLYALPRPSSTPLS